MPLPANKATTPFKTMDIKAALLAGGNRKRKATSPQICKDDTKIIKLGLENKDDHENDVETLDEACGITITLQPSELDSNLGDCKENKDINSAKNKSPVSDSKENKLSTPNELSPSVNKTHCKQSKLDSPKQIHSDNDIEMLSDNSRNSVTSEDELNSSVNVSLNTSGTAEEEDNKGNKSEVSDKDGEKTPKLENNVKENVRKKRMTPAEAQKKAEEREEKQKANLLKKQEKENRKNERLLEKQRKLKEKKVRKEREEMEKKERERIKQEKKEQEEKERLEKQKEKEEKAKIKQMQLELKLEEKKRKEEMKLKREEELKKAEEEKLRAKLEKEQKENEKKERARAAFAKFFVKGESNTSASTAQVAEKEGAFLPFQVSDDMILAPVVPLAAQERFDKKQLDHYLEQQDGKELYLQVLKLGSYKDVRQRKRNQKLKASEADVIVIDENAAQADLGLCPKLLQFSENVRPPYWGTWRKRSKNIRPRNPFGEDEIFDYSVDSDDEWDEGGPGESLSGTENEDESEDEYEVDNEFFVPHGYLSDEEEKNEDDDEVNDPEKQKAVLKLKLQEFELERKKKTTELKPIILGCYFVNNPDFQDNGLQMFLETYCAQLISETPILTSFTVKNQLNDGSNSTAESPKSANSGSSKKKKLFLVPDEAFPQLILLVHGNIKNRKMLAEEFKKWVEQSGEKQESNQQTIEPSSNTDTDPSKEVASGVSSDTALISLRRISETIREIAAYGKSPDTSFNKCCWWVHDHIREKYGLMNAPIPNQWKYVSQKET